MSYHTNMEENALSIDSISLSNIGVSGVTEGKKVKLSKTLFFRVENEIALCPLKRTDSRKIRVLVLSLYDKHLEDFLDKVETSIMDSIEQSGYEWLENDVSEDGLSFRSLIKNNRANKDTFCTEWPISVADVLVKAGNLDQIIAGDEVVIDVKIDHIAINNDTVFLYPEVKSMTIYHQDIFMSGDILNDD